MSLSVHRTGPPRPALLIGEIRKLLYVAKKQVLLCNPRMAGRAVNFTTASDYDYYKNFAATAENAASVVCRTTQRLQRWLNCLRLLRRNTFLRTQNSVKYEVSDWQRLFFYRILLVDDDPIIRQVGEDLLKSEGYEVLCAEDGFDALVALKRSLPDIIISDLRMPNMNGFEFLSVVRRRFPTVPVIVISGEFSGVDVPESVLADAFFQKASIVWKSSLVGSPSYCMNYPPGHGLEGQTMSRSGSEIIEE